jgi:hypothetical protein
MEHSGRGLRFEEAMLENSNGEGGRILPRITCFHFSSAQGGKTSPLLDSGASRDNYRYAPSGLMQ